MTYITNKLGDRIELVAMGEDPFPIKPGERGYAQVGVKWDSGRSLMLVPLIDRWRTLTALAKCDACGDETGEVEIDRQCGRDLGEESPGAGVCAGTYRRAER